VLNAIDFIPVPSQNPPDTFSANVITQASGKSAEHFASIQKTNFNLAEEI
jgi:hypothetical protein